MDIPISYVERQLIREMDALTSKILEPNGQRIYDLIIEDSGIFISGDLVNLRHGGSAYLLWAAVTDLVGAPGGPHSDEACDKLAHEVSRSWLQTNHESYEAIETYFETWLARI